MARLEINNETLRPLIEQVVAETIERLESRHARFAGQIAFTEPEAAALLGVQPHVLRDLRLVGAIEAARVGRRIVYTRADLMHYLEQNRWARK